MATPSNAPLTSALQAQIVQASSDAILTTTLEGFVTSWNPAAEMYFGASASEIIGKGITVLVPPNLETEYHSLRWRVAAGMRVEPWFTRFRHKQGALLEVRVAMSVLSDIAAMPVGIVYIVSLVPATTRVKAALFAHSDSLASVADLSLELLENSEQERHETESQHRLLLESATDYALFALNPEGRVKTWNLGAQRLHGFRSDDIVGAHFEVFYSPDARRAGRVRRVLETASQLGRHEEESSRVRKNGSEFWAHTTLNLMRDAHGQPSGFVVVVRDLTEQRQLLERQRLLSSSVENNPDCVLITDAALDLPGPRILYANPSFERMSGYRLVDLLGQTPRLFQGPDTDRDMLRRLRKALEERRIFVAETTNYRSDGTPYRVRWQITPIFDATGAITHFVSVQRDVTVRHEHVTSHSNLESGTSFPEVVRVLDFTVSGGALLPGSSFRGRLEHVGGAGSLVQMLSVSNPSGALVLNGQIRLHLHGGRIVYLEHPRLTGIEAAVNAFQLESGTFEFTTIEHQPEAVLEINPVNVALEAARRNDEARHSGEWPALNVPDSSEGVLVVPTVQVAVTFASSVGIEHFRATLRHDPSWGSARVVLTGRGFRVVAMQGDLSQVPSQMERYS